MVRGGVGAGGMEGGVGLLEEEELGTSRWSAGEGRTTTRATEWNPIIDWN